MPGDQAFNLLFQNPGHGRHWLKLKLKGTRSNRSAIGARIRAEVKGAGGKIRAIHRQVGGGSSYGGNSLVETIGLGDTTTVATLEVVWPASGTHQVFHDLPADRLVEITEGTDRPKVVVQPPLSHVKAP